MKDVAHANANYFFYSTSYGDNIVMYSCMQNTTIFLITKYVIWDNT